MKQLLSEELLDDLYGWLSDRARLPRQCRNCPAL
jgi:hypothetical protein